ncbi:isocitrate lyase/PEP mutase family protein [Kiloniella antarctica]|uniref:Isocitrate lyase/phosphoenolpyruvate mutase family protein n=1 Tax=Kiloniella antarctica TaxID=1550907 RepID=A0ABW5BH18_9PROT
MTTSHYKAQTLHKLHIKGDPLILQNIWDAGSAKVVANSGAQAIATGSWPVASAFGYADGEQLPLDLALANIKRISDSVDLPVTMDIEAGYGRTPENVGKTVTLALQNGAVGFNLEDQNISNSSLFSIEEQSKRIKAARAVSDALEIFAFINARTDVFLQANADDDNAKLFTEVVARSKAYFAAGANGLFIPGLIDADLIEELCKSSPLPINIMVMPDCPTNNELTKLGVSRISYGPGPYQAAMKLLESQCHKLYS